MCVVGCSVSREGSGGKLVLPTALTSGLLGSLPAPGPQRTPPSPSMKGCGKLGGLDCGTHGRVSSTEEAALSEGQEWRGQARSPQGNMASSDRSSPGYQWALPPGKL